MKKISSIFKTLIITLLFLSLPFKVYAADKNKIIGSCGPIENAIAVSKEGWCSSNSVIVANVDKFPDSMCSVIYAHLKGAPILLTYGDKVDSAVLEEIKRLNASNAYIFGGPGVISEALAKDLQNNGLNVYRLGGIDRFKTAIEAGEAVRNTIPFDTVFLTYGYDFPDSLSAATYSAINGYPILYTESEALNGDTAKVLENWSVKKVFILGGTGVVSEDVESQIKKMGIEVERLGGRDRYDTAVKIVSRFSTGKENGFTFVTGESFQDALVGAAFAAKVNAPVIIYDEGSTSGDVKEIIKDISKDKHNYKIGNLEEYISPAGTDSLKTLRSNNRGSDYFEAKINGYIMDITGRTDTENKWAMLCIDKIDEKKVTDNVKEVVVPIDDDGKYYGSVELSNIDDNCIFGIYMNSEKNGNGWYEEIYNSIPLNVLPDNEVVFKLNSEIYNKNIEYQNENKTLDASQYIQPVYNETIKEFALGLVKDIKYTGDKVKAIHDWIADNIYYDYDAYYGTSGALDVYDGEKCFSTKRAVCQGYAELFNIMLHSVGIPSRVVHGKAINYNESWDTEDRVPNHAWNEVNIDGRWVTIDVTWDSTNKYEKQEYQKGIIRYTYYDPTVEFFSISHMRE